MAITRRRHCLLKRLFAERRDDPNADTWKHKQLAEPGDVLPPSFPWLSTLSAAGYTTVQDLDGATHRELRRIGLNRRDADEILAALAALV